MRDQPRVRGDDGEGRVKPLIVCGPPRACGENRDGDTCRYCGIGPTPRARGAPAGSASRSRPADRPRVRGQTDGAARSSTGFRDQPRVRGNRETLSDVSISLGPAPRARGKYRRAGQLGRRRGTSPACDGKRLGDDQVPPRAGTSPACGENVPNDDDTRYTTGPAPGSRGNLLLTCDSTK